MQLGELASLIMLDQSQIVTAFDCRVPKLSKIKDCTALIGLGAEHALHSAWRTSES